MTEIEKALTRLTIAKKNKSKEIRISFFEYERLMTDIVVMQQKIEELSKIDTPKKIVQSKTIVLDGKGFI